MPRTSAKSKKRSSEESAGFVLNHRVRVEILAALNEAERSESELVRLLRLPQSTVQYHLGELLSAGSVEAVGTRSRRGYSQRLYKAVGMADFLAEEIAEWPFEKRQAFWGVVIQGAGAEDMAALHAGTISREDKSWLAWARFNFDRRGVVEAYDALEDCWDRLREIESESDGRASDESEQQTFIYSLKGYPRSRRGRSSYPKAGA